MNKELLERLKYFARENLEEILKAIEAEITRNVNIQKSKGLSSAEIEDLIDGWDSSIAASLIRDVFENNNENHLNWRQWFKFAEDNDNGASAWDINYQSKLEQSFPGMAKKMFPKK
jgi:predicted TPR repeat methyltransferase